MNSFNIIAAVDADYGIGKEGKLPWHLSADLKHFKEITCKTQAQSKTNAVIMGRKTWDSLPEAFRPLPKRINCVITQNELLSFPEGVIKAKNLDDALAKLNNEEPKKTIENIFVIGGGQIYTSAIEHHDCKKIFLTHIVNKFNCDIFFPDFKKYFSPAITSESFKEGSLEYYFIEYLRNFSDQ